jgi:anion-transporting  ArsA/GET3 family ATPase
MRARVRTARDLFRDPKQTEFVIATIPTMLGINESSRLAKTLKDEGIPCKRIVVNQASCGAGPAPGRRRPPALEEKGAHSTAPALH